MSRWPSRTQRSVNTPDHAGVSFYCAKHVAAKLSTTAPGTRFGFRATEVREHDTTSSNDLRETVKKDYTSNTDTYRDDPMLTFHPVSGH